MEATNPVERPRRLPTARANVNFQLVSTWLLGFGLVVYLGLEGGGYDPLIDDQAGIVIWWAILAGLLVGAFPRRRLGRLGWGALSLLAAFVAWTALSLLWTESHGNTSADLARILGYLGIFALGLFTRGSSGARSMVAAVGTGIAVIAVVALLSRLHPAWFAGAEQTARFLPGARNRLSYPLNYWNGLAALIAIGLPLILHLASTAKALALRSLAAAALPALALAVYFTLSRAGILAGVVAILLYVTFAEDRVPKLSTLAIATVGAVILLIAASQRHALEEGLANTTAHQQGDGLMLMAIVVCLGVGLLQAATSRLLLDDDRPAWTVPSRRLAVGATAIAIVALLFAAAAAGAPRRISHALDEFKSSEVARGGSSRLTSAYGGNRYGFWSSALDQFSSEPLHGTGSGTFEYWWARNGNSGQSVHDAHSLYLQTLGELGIIGFVLLTGFVVAILGGGTWSIARAGPGRRSQLSAALAGCVAFFVGAALDWTWQIPVLPIAMLLIGAVLVTAGTGSGTRPRATLRLPARVALAGFALLAIIAISIPLSSATLIRQSQDDVRTGRLGAALQAAQTAANVEPEAAQPDLQQALVLERQQDYAAAVQAARDAADHEPTNWQNWLILSRVQVEAGQGAAAAHSYRKAASLNPRSPLFAND